MTITYRESPLPTDITAVRNVVESTGFFRPDEVDVAVELVEEARAKGAEKSGYHFLFAEDGERLLGYTCFGPIACTLHSFDLYWIVVHNDCRGQGIGKALLARTEEILTRMGCTRLYAETSSTELYAPTRSYYLKAGFFEEARIREFYAPGDDKVLFTKIISE
jgi:GNAT superfamily N-acetyltransferase